jgi:hypothetical protein
VTLFRSAEFLFLVGPCWTKELCPFANCAQPSSLSFFPPPALPNVSTDLFPSMQLGQSCSIMEAQHEQQLSNPLDYPAESVGAYTLPDLNASLFSPPFSLLPAPFPLSLVTLRCHCGLLACGRTFCAPPNPLTRARALLTVVPSRYRYHRLRHSVRHERASTAATLPPTLPARL